MDWTESFGAKIARRRGLSPEEVVASEELRHARQRARSGKTVTKSNKHTSHTFHLLMTVCTGGLWLPAWAVMALIHKFGPKEKSVTKGK